MNISIDKRTSLSFLEYSNKILHLLHSVGAPKNLYVLLEQKQAYFKKDSGFLAPEVWEEEDNSYKYRFYKEFVDLQNNYKDDEWKDILRDFTKKYK